MLPAEADLLLPQLVAGLPKPLQACYLVITPRSPMWRAYPSRCRHLTPALARALALLLPLTLALLLPLTLTPNPNPYPTPNP